MIDPETAPRSIVELDRAEFVAPTPTGETRVLHPITLRLAERRIALIGANGSGKSSLARMLNGLIEPSAGTVRVSASDPPRWHDTVRDGATVRRLVGFVFTDPAAQLVMPTAIEDVSLSLRRSHPRKSDRIAAARAALSELGLEHLAERSVHTLSGGQQQMLAIASVLATRPAILVADEPTTLLDLRNGGIVSQLLLGLPQQLIVATHDLELAARCDRVIVVADGAIAHDSGASGEGDPGAAVDWYRASVAP